MDASALPVGLGGGGKKNKVKTSSFLCNELNPSGFFREGNSFYGVINLGLFANSDSLNDRYFLLTTKKIIAKS